MGTSNLTNKIKVHDIAKSFNLPSKEIMNILTEYSTTPKSHSAVMTEEEISIVLDYLTQKHQISSIEEIFADCFSNEPEQSKEELGAACGRTSCAMLAITESGLALSAAVKLAAAFPEQYDEAVQALQAKDERIRQRRGKKRPRKTES